MVELDDLLPEKGGLALDDLSLANNDVISPGLPFIEGFDAGELLPIKIYHNLDDLDILVVGQLAVV